MKPTTESAASRLFTPIALIEAVSTLFLFLVAMPLKYALDIPEPTRYAGWVHGLLFMLYMVALLAVAVRDKWAARWVAYGFLAAVIPGGPFLFERQRPRHARSAQ